MKLKKAMAFLLAFVLLLSFCGCAKNNGPDDGMLSSSVDSSQQSSGDSLQTNSSLISSFLSSSSQISSGDSSNVSSQTSSKKPVEEATGSVLNFGDMKAVWLSQFDLNGIYCSNGAQRPKADFETRITAVLKNVKELGFNTIIVQVRPYADSFYPSSLFPASVYVTGVYGKNLSYDPFAVIVAKAHSLNLSVHAWINPMRAMTESEIEKVPNIYKIKQWYNAKNDFLINVAGRLYLNPAYSEVRKLIIDGAAEILRLYKVDGLHMDDYFYPTTDESFDKTAYENYLKSGGDLSLFDFRRASLNALVSGLYSAVKSQNKNMFFGISPAGNINAVFDEHFADIYSWCSRNGYIDYICPQIYFGLQHETHDFKSVCKVWQAVVKNNNVKLIIGMTLGKAKEKDDPYAGKGRNEWKENSDILKRCLEFTKNLEKCSGVSFFSYQYFYSPLENTPDPDTKAERDNLIPLLKEIKW